MEEGRVDFCYASAVVIDDEGIEINRHITKNNSGYLFGSLLRQYDINMQSAMVRHDLLLDNKITFDLSLKYSPDYNLFMKIAAIAYTGVLRECLVKYRMTGASLTAKSYNLIYNERKYTLDLLCRHSELFIRNRTSFDYAFNMLNYYEAIKYISTGEYVLARACFRKVLNIKWKYTIFYLLLFLPLSPSFFLKSFFK